MAMVAARKLALGSAAILTLMGCGLLGGSETAETPTATVSLSKYQKLAEQKPDAPAGVPVEPNTSMDNLKKLVASKVFPSRPDPFSLLPVEAKFDKDQAAARFVQTGGFMTVWTPPAEEMEEVVAVEPQPVRRLAGVVVSNGAVLILIDMGDGKGVQLARAGSKLGEWTVASIDTEKAILKRDPKKRPSEVLVPLASPLELGTPGGGGNVPGGPGGRPGGGMMPPGMGPMGPGVGGPMGPGMGPSGPVDF